jgi:pyruvate carboxylase
MTANNYTSNDIVEKGDSISFPDSVIELFRGDLGMNPGGFPEELSKKILKGKLPYTGRPNDHLDAIDFDKAFEEFQAKFGMDYNFLDCLSYLFYPKVFEDYAKQRDKFGPLWHMPTLAFFYGLKNNQETFIELSPGKNILIRMLNVIDEGDGKKLVFFRLNGQTRSVEVIDQKFVGTKATNKKVSSENEFGSPLQGRLSKVMVKVGEKVEKNTPLFTIEAMKMESTVVASKAGSVSSILLNDGVLIEQDDVVVVID